MSEEKQGQNIVEAAVASGVKCFLWSTLPSSREISGGRFETRLYEGKGCATRANRGLRAG